MAPSIFSEDFVQNRDLVHAGEGDNKTPMLTDILDAYDADPSKAILFDDSITNLQYAEEVGVQWEEVSKETGVTIEEMRSFVEGALNVSHKDGDVLAAPASPELAEAVSVSLQMGELLGN